MQNQQHYFDANKDSWNKRTAVHKDSDFYDLASFKKGKSSLNKIELEELGDVSGKSLLHLQCHFGMDTMSWARMGADCVGVDLSDEAINLAKEINAELKLHAEFVCCNVYDLKQHLDKKFDIVFTSYGTIGWLPDLDAWAAIVWHFLKPGGTFYIADFHPTLWMMDENFERLYTLIWIISFYLNGIYDKKYRIQDIVISTVIGFMINLSIYALMPESLRSSRLLLSALFLWVLVYVFFGRLIFNRIFRNNWKLSNEHIKSIIIIGDEQEESSVKNILMTNKIEYRIVTRINSSEKSLNLNWSDVAQLYRPDEIIFCPSINSVLYIMKIIGQLPEYIQIKILNPSGSGIIGSSDSKAVGELYTFEFSYNLQKEKYQRQKRFFDISFSLLVIIFMWLLIFIYKNKLKFLSNTFNVLFGFKTWVALGNLVNESYPSLINKPGILEPLNRQQKYQGKELVVEVYKNYLWNYSIWMDMDICLRDINQLDH